MSFSHLRALLQEDAEDLLSGVNTLFDDLIGVLRRWKKDPVAERSRQSKEAARLPAPERLAALNALNRYLDDIFQNIEGGTPPIMTALKMASVSKEARNLFVSATGAAGAAISSLAAAFFDEAARSNIISREEQRNLEGAVERGAPVKPDKFTKDFINHNKLFLRRRVFDIDRETLLINIAAAQKLLIGRLARTRPDQKKVAVMAAFQVMLLLREHFTQAEKMLSTELKRGRKAPKATQP